VLSTCPDILEIGRKSVNRSAHFSQNSVNKSPEISRKSLEFRAGKKLFTLCGLLLYNSEAS
jgi:hypothetical protein